MSLEIKVTRKASHDIFILLSTNGLEASACDTLPVDGIHVPSLFRLTVLYVRAEVWCFDDLLCMRPATAASPLYKSTRWPSSATNLLELPELLKLPVLDAPVTTVDVTQQTSTQMLMLSINTQVRQCTTSAWSLWRLKAKAEAAYWGTVGTALDVGSLCA